MARNLIFNADDFGASVGVNRGIVECHTRGVLTSTGLMVTGRAVDEAVAMSRDNPKLAIGLHWDVWGEDEREFDLSNTQAVRDEFRRQFDEFIRLMGRLPTHIDSHRHAHREREAFSTFLELVAGTGVPLRGDGQVNFVGGFYAQWEWMVTDLAHVSVDALEGMLRKEVPEGWTEFSCHPGYVSDDYTAVYLAEREAEVRTLVDPRIKKVIGEEGIQLRSYADFNAERR
ncbi:MAG: ChbG/HpnK family deacetylase [Planctomycetota bacterium]|nr:ChbG/HpnK family deacetylase [Planctomycetota bacterium]